jgi:hypothetical protein
MPRRCFGSPLRKIDEFASLTSTPPPPDGEGVAIMTMPRVRVLHGQNTPLTRQRGFALGNVNICQQVDQ